MAKWASLLLAYRICVSVSIPSKDALMSNEDVADAVETYLFVVLVVESHIALRFRIVNHEAASLRLNPMAVSRLVTLEVFTTDSRAVV